MGRRRLSPPRGQLQRIATGAQIRVIDGDYFGVLGIPLLGGRTFTSMDGLDTAGVALISRSLAHAVYPGRTPLGEAFGTGGRGFRVIGVVDDVAYEAGGARQHQVYLSHLQFADDRTWTLTYVVRMQSGGDLAGSARAALARLDPALVLFQPRPLDAVVARHRARDRFTLLLMTTFAAVALSLAAIGL